MRSWKCARSNCLQKHRCISELHILFSQPVFLFLCQSVFIIIALKYTQHQCDASRHILFAHNQFGYSRFFMELCTIQIICYRPTLNIIRISIVIAGSLKSPRWVNMAMLPILSFQCINAGHLPISLFIHQFFFNSVLYFQVKRASSSLGKHILEYIFSVILYWIIFLISFLNSQHMKKCYLFLYPATLQNLFMRSEVLGCRSWDIFRQKIVFTLQCL